jgi:integrase
MLLPTWVILEDGRVVVPLHGPRSITWKPFYSAKRMYEWAQTPAGLKALRRNAKFDPPRIPETELKPKARFLLYLFRRTIVLGPKRAADSMRSVTVRVGPLEDERAGQTSKFSGLGPPPPLLLEVIKPTLSAVAAANSRCPIRPTVLVEEAVPYRARRVRESYRRSVREHVRKQRDHYGRLAKQTAYHRERDLLRWPEMCRRAGVLAEISGARDIAPEQVLAVKRSGIWETTTLKPIFSGLRTYCREEGNSELAYMGSVWKLARGTADRRMWLTEIQLAMLYALAVGRVKVRVALQGFLGMREDSARALLVRDLMFEGAHPRMSFAAKGPDGERQTIPVDSEVAGLLLSWIEEQGLRPGDRVYGVSHSTADADLRALGIQAGIPLPVSGHVLRRSWARIAYLASPSMEQVRRTQRVLGHRDIRQTWWYIGDAYLDMEAGLSLFADRMREASRPLRG